MTNGTSISVAMRVTARGESDKVTRGSKHTRTYADSGHAGRRGTVKTYLGTSYTTYIIIHHAKESSQDPNEMVELSYGRCGVTPE